MGIKYTILVLLLSLETLNAQECTYIIDGTVKGITNGKAFLVNHSLDKKYFGKSKDIDSALIKNGHFKMKIGFFDDIIRPYRFLIQSKFKNGLTDLIFIEPKNQVVFVDTISEKIAPRVLGSRIQSEMKYTYSPYFSAFVKEIEEHERYEDELFQKYPDELPIEQSLEVERRQRNLLSKSDSLLFFYALKHPNSLVTLWKLIEKFSNWGYRKEYTSIYHLLSKNITNSYAGKMLVVDLNASKILAIGNSFPAIKVKNLASENITVDSVFLGNKYTLIDFWFSHCRPCLVQFPTYKKLMNDFNTFGFNIIGISVDNKDDIDNWKDVIKDKVLNWEQYLDENGKVSETWKVNAFPTNYLLDKNGKIVAKNISPGALSNFLNMNLNPERIYDKIYRNEPN